MVGGGKYHMCNEDGEGGRVTQEQWGRGAKQCHRERHRHSGSHFLARVKYVGFKSIMDQHGPVFSRDGPYPTTKVESNFLDFFLSFFEREGELGEGQGRGRERWG